MANSNHIRISDVAQTLAEARAIVIAASIEKLYVTRGIPLSDAEYLALAHGIRSGLYRQIATDRLGQPVYEIPYRDTVLTAVWSRELDCVRTFLGQKIAAEQMRPRAGQESPRWKRRMAAAAEAVFKQPADGGAA